MIPVAKPFLPSREKLNKYIDGIYERQWVTNNGPLLQELTLRLEEYLGVRNLLLVSNGTLALQIAYSVLGVSNKNEIASESPEAITTPFTFVATASSLKWEGVQPVFSDVDAGTWCLNPDNIKSYITKNTKAIVPVHVFGNACDVEKIDEISKRHNLSVIYDASHAFGVKYKDRSLLEYGDASTLSFHATKLFHSIEGGAIIFKRKKDLEQAREMINFGISSTNNFTSVGINAKMNEFQSAMGLCVLDEIEANLLERKKLVEYYKSNLPKKLKLQFKNSFSTDNYAYMPILFESEEQVLNLLGELESIGVIARRYFYPSLDTTDYNLGVDMLISQDIASRIVCLPLYAGLSMSDVDRIVQIVKEVTEL